MLASCFIVGYILSLSSDIFVIILAYLKDIAGLVSDHCKKANIASNKTIHTIYFWFFSAYKSYVYTDIFHELCNSIISKKCTVHTLIKNSSSLKNTIIWAFNELQPCCWWRVLPRSLWMLAAWPGWWSLTLGWLLPFLKIRQHWNLPHQFIDSSFYEQFLSSTWCCLIAFYPQ